MKFNWTTLGLSSRNSTCNFCLYLSPGAYGEYLEYLLKKQPAITPEIKNLYYKILNNTTDDYSKNQISGLLDFLFNPSREKERV